ncbi:hypothetical protein, conserved, partial [Eimeria acervulina]
KMEQFVFDGLSNHRSTSNEVNNNACLMTTHGHRVALLVNYPQANLNSFSLRDAVGRQIDIVRNLHKRWTPIIRWALKQDMSGYTKLASDELHKKADDMQSWVRLMHRYANLAIAADAVKMTTEKKQLMHRYANLAIAADAVKMTTEKKQVYVHL